MGKDLWNLGPLELVFAEHPQFADAAMTDSLSHVGTAVSTWNASIVNGYREVQNELLEAIAPALRRWRNPNMIIVPQLDGCTELHVMLVSLCPDAVLKHHQLRREIANCSLWPITVRPPNCAQFARKAEEAFADFAWRRVARKGQREDLDEHSSLRLLADDSRFWMHEAFRVTAELLPPINERDIDPGQELFLTIAYELYTQAHLKSIRIANDRITAIRADGSKLCMPFGELDLSRFGKPLVGKLTLPAGGVEWSPAVERARREALEKRQIIWDPFDQHQREDIFEAICQGPEVQSIETVAALLRREVLPEDLPDRRHSKFKEDVQRRLYHKRNKIKVKFCDLEDKAHTHVAQPLSVDEGLVLRDMMVLLDPLEQKVVVLLRDSRTQTEIAQEMGGVSPSTISRRIAMIQNKLRPIFGDG